MQKTQRLQRAPGVGLAPITHRAIVPAAVPPLGMPDGLPAPALVMPKNASLDNDAWGRVGADRADVIVIAPCL